MADPTPSLEIPRAVTVLACPVHTVRLSDVLARLLHPTDRMLAACRHVAVELLPPGHAIRAPKDSGAIVTVGNAARAVLFEAAHQIAHEYGQEIV